MTTVAIVYHSGFGHTRVQAEAVRDGAASIPDTTVHLVPVEDHEQHWSELDDADAIVFGAPTYMAGASAPFKAFLDATSGRWSEQRWKDKLAAGFTNSAGSERRQARHPATARAVRDAAQHDLGRARAASRQPHRCRLA